MGPRLFSRGYHWYNGSVARGAVSSMGPRLFSRGYTETKTPRQRYFLLFNGATTLQPWILEGADYIEIVALVFNGATTLQPWILAADMPRGSKRRSSMGPRLFSRGYTVLSLSPRRTSPVFNGATTLQPWIPRLCRTTRGALKRFFNGATTLQPWILTPNILPIEILRRLQWGHDSSAVDTTAGTTEPGQAPNLQWGHDSSAVDTGFGLGNLDMPAYSSMGPRLFSRGYPALC